MKKIYLLAVLALTFASASGAGKEKAQIIIRQQGNDWQMYAFGLPPCPGNKNIHLVLPEDSTKPLEVICEAK